MDTHRWRRSGAARHRTTFATLATTTLACLLVPTGAHAATITVASGLVEVSDDGLCSLGEAIANAEADARPHGDCPAGSGHDVLTLEPGTYLLHSRSASAFLITSDVTLVGAGSVARAGGEATVLDAGGTSRHFDVADDASLHLEALRLTGGSADDGGAVRSGVVTGPGWVDPASFSATDVQFTDNHADGDGGAVLVWGHTTLVDTVFTGNHADRGAAIFSAGELSLLDGLVASNHASQHGAVHVGGVAHVVGSTIRDNTGTGLVNSLSTVTIQHSTISGNDGVLAGGLYAEAAWSCGFYDCFQIPSTTIVRDSTFSGNTASAGAGAIWASDVVADMDDPWWRAELTLTNVTVASNSSPGGGQVRASAPTVRNSVFADAVGGVNCDVTDDVHDGWTWNGHDNVSDDPSCSSGGFTQVEDALLGPLASNGGPTATHLPHPASPLIDAGDQATCDGGVRAGGSTTDQRGAGFARTVGDACDIGAVEADAPALLSSLTADVEAVALRGGPSQRQEGLRTSLLAKLGAASDAVQRGDHEAAAGQLGAFTEQVDAYAGGPIMEHDADRLTTGAAVIIDLLPRAAQGREGS